MKRRYTFIALFFIGVFTLSFSTLTNLDDVIASFKLGKVTNVSKYFDNNVEITLLDNSNSYSKSQAALVLNDFFSTNKIIGFDVMHKGENGGSQYCIGTLRSKNKNYRTTIFMKQKANTLVLQELRFEIQ